MWISPFFSVPGMVLYVLCESWNPFFMYSWWSSLCNSIVKTVSDWLLPLISSLDDPYFVRNDLLCLRISCMKESFMIVEPKDYIVWMWLILNKKLHKKAHWHCLLKIESSWLIILAIIWYSDTSLLHYLWLNPCLSIF